MAPLQNIICYEIHVGGEVHRDIYRIKQVPAIVYLKTVVKIDNKQPTPREKLISKLLSTQKSRDSLGKPSDVSVGGALIWKHGVLNIKICLICQQI